MVVRFSLSLAQRLLFLFCWCVVMGAAGLLLLEESGILAEVIRDRVAWRLGPLGEGLRIKRVNLRWFEPGLVLEDVSLRAPAPPGTARPELLRLRSLHLSLNFDWKRGVPLRQLQVRGGRIRVSNDLIEGLNRFAASLEGSDQREETLQELRPPPFLATNIEVEIELPDASLFDLGTANLLAKPDLVGGYQLSGELIPSLAGAVTEPVSIHVDGRQWDTGVQLHASARELNLQSAGFEAPEAMGSLPISGFSGLLTLEAVGRLEFGEESVAQASLRARLEEGRLQTAPGLPWFEDLALGLDAAFRPGTQDELWDRDAWVATSRLEANWNATPLRAFGEFGKNVPRDAWAHVWARAERLPLSAETLELFGAKRRLEHVWAAFQPEGQVDAALDWRLARALRPERPEPSDPPEPLAWENELAVHLRPVGESGFTYFGFPDPEGNPTGVPLPCRDVRGDLYLTTSARSERAFRLAMLDLEARAGGGRANGTGLLAAPKRSSGRLRPELDLSFDLPDVPLDDAVREALAANPNLADIWPTYRPQGGVFSSSWRLHASPRTRGLTGYGRGRVRGADVAWSELPVPLRDTSGELTFVWGARPTQIVESPGQSYRPFGLTYDFQNDQAEGARRGVRARLRGFAREESLPPRIRRADIPLEWVQGVEVEIGEMLLRGTDWEILTESFPELKEQSTELSASGSMHVLFDGSQSHADQPFVTHTEATPNVLALTPKFFQRRTEDVTGRVLVRTVETGEDESEVSTRFALSGSWPGNVELAAWGDLPPVGPSAVLVQAAGVDPTNSAFKGALLASMSADDSSMGREFDASELSLFGRFDFDVAVRFLAESDDEPENVYRFFLRENGLRNGSLRFDSLQGVLTQSGNLLRGDLLLGELAGHPIELADVLVYYLEDVESVPDSDPLLLRRGFVRDPRTMVLQAELRTQDLPLDEEHLRSLLDPETLKILRDSPTWRGSIDVLGAQLLLTGDTDVPGLFVLHGPLRLHDLAMRMGVPIEVGSAEVTLEEFVVEADRVRGWGVIENLAATIAERELTNARMIVGYVDGRLSVDNLAGDFVGGRLTSLGTESRGARKAFGVDLAEPHRFDLAVRLKEAQVDELLAGVFHSTFGDSGILNANIQLAGTPFEVTGLTGRGAFSLDEGRLWSIPVMRELFSQLGADSAGVFDRMRARFELRDGLISSSYVELKSPLLYLIGNGSLDLEGPMRLDLEARYGILDVLGPFNRVLYWLNNSLWRIAIRGDFFRPKVSVRNPFLEWIGRFDDHPERALPLPEFMPLPERF